MSIASMILSALSETMRAAHPRLMEPAAILAAIVLSAIPARAGSLEGAAAYRERIALPPGAVLEAVLEDLSRADAPAEVLGRTRIDPAGQPPFPITYDDPVLRPGDRYIVRATVLYQGRLLFTSDQAYPVHGDLSAPLRMLLVKPRRSPASRELERSDLAAAGQTVLTGMFTYMADAASIALCADGRKLPVAMEADFASLEAAYRRAHQQPGRALLATVEGHIAARPSGEQGQTSRLAIVVERFISIWPGETCGNRMANSRLRGTYWKLVRLHGKPVQVVERQREPHLIFADHERRVFGSGGCNRVTGNFEFDDDRLHLGRMAATMMACPAGMEQEQVFLQSMSKVERYRISGSHLEMLDEHGTAIARFEAVDLR